MVAKIVTLNVWGGALREEMLDCSVAADADVLCLQVVPRTAPGTPDWLTYRDGEVELAQRAKYDTTTGPYHPQARYYDPTLGRFTQPGPLRTRSQHLHLRLRRPDKPLGSDPGCQLL